jgi:hypothetical protein
MFGHDADEVPADWKDLVIRSFSLCIIKIVKPMSKI